MWPKWLIHKELFQSFLCNFNDFSRQNFPLKQKATLHSWKIPIPGPSTHRRSQNSQFQDLPLPEDSQFCESSFHKLRNGFETLSGFEGSVKGLQRSNFNFYWPTTVERSLCAVTHILVVSKSFSLDQSFTKLHYKGCNCTLPVTRDAEKTTLNTVCNQGPLRVS